MSHPPKTDVSFEVDGARYVLAYDFAAIAYFEEMANVSMIDAMADMERAQAAGRTPKISHLGYMLQAGFRKHHPDMTTDEALKMAMNPEVQKQLGVAVAASMPDASDGEVGNRPAPAKKAASTGTKSSRARSKRG